jgi:hypothetical protein
MNDATLSHFRAIAEAMTAEPKNGIVPATVELGKEALPTLSR